MSYYCRIIIEAFVGRILVANTWLQVDVGCGSLETEGELLVLPSFFN